MTTPPHLNPPTPKSPEPGFATSGPSGPGSLPGRAASGASSASSGNPQAAGRGSGPAAGQVDVRGPRFGAVITSVLLAVVVVASLVAPTAALVGLALMTGLFAWGAFAGIRRHPWGRIFQRFVRPRLGPPTGFEDAAAPTFAQGVGLAVTGIGVVLAIAGVPHAVTVAASLAFLAAFLNAAFGLCLGCELYAILIRLGIAGGSGRGRPA